MAGHRREEADGPPVDSLEMPEEQGQTHEMDGSELVGQTLQGHGNPVDDSRLHEVLLEFVNIRAQLPDLPMLEFRDTPDQKGDPHPVLGERRRHRLAQESSRLIGDLKASVDRVIVGEGDEIHPGTP